MFLLKLLVYSSHLLFMVNMTCQTNACSIVSLIDLRIWRSKDLLSPDNLSKYFCRAEAVCFRLRILLLFNVCAPASSSLPTQTRLHRVDTVIHFYSLISVSFDSSEVSLLSLDTQTACLQSCHLGMSQLQCCYKPHALSVTYFCRNFSSFCNSVANLSLIAR